LSLHSKLSEHSHPGKRCGVWGSRLGRHPHFAK
jgi:hypothetical protein